MLQTNKMKNKTTAILLSAIILATCCCTQNNPPTYEPTTIQETSDPYVEDVEESSACITAKESWNHIGDQTCVEYKVINAYTSTAGNTFLNEKSDYKTGFTTTIFANAQQNFPDPANTYNQKTIQITGLIKLYDGHPEIIAETPDQIKIIG